MERAEAERLFLPAARDAARAFPVSDPCVSLVTVSENVTFRLTDGETGEDWVLRLHRPGYNSAAELEAERVWTAALRAAGLATPEPLPARDGRAFVAQPVEATGETRLAGVTRWIDGEVLDDLLRDPAQSAERPGWFARLGALVARTHLQSEAWTPPPGFVRPWLDADGLMGPAPRWGPFWDHAALSAEDRERVLAVRDLLYARLSVLPKDPAVFGMIHADLHPGNLLIRQDGLAIIDFDDAAFGWRMYDIAVALTHQQSAPDFEAVRDAFLAGYRSVRDLPEAEAVQLPHFLLVRDLVQLGWLHERPEIDPGDGLPRRLEQVRLRCQAVLADV
ncbi:MAG: phosphotransferase [Phenylobacterium sp.]|nr:phosphotransferase [Phenylobacterium sp.]